MNATSGEPLAILAGVRTPFVKAFGPLAGVPADRLGTSATQALFERAGLSADDFEEAIFGCVSGQADAANVARVIGLRAGLPNDRIGHTVNRNCASGMEAVISAWQAMQDRHRKIILAGGTESMSQVPLYWNKPATEWFLKLGRMKTLTQRLAHFTKFRPSFMKPVPGLQLGLTDPVCKLNMGETAENLARDFQITREAQDLFALQSHERAIAAQKAGFFTDEISPVSADLTGGKEVAADIGPREGQTLEALAKLRSYFRPHDGTVTVGNSCPVTDGAVALAVTTAKHARQLRAKPLGYLRAYSIAGLDPSRMGLGPVFAIHQLLEQTGQSLADFDLVEINEAFAVQVLACLEAMASPEFCREKLGRNEPIGELNQSVLNVHGGAIALGHPVGATGARLILTLLRSLHAKGLRRGLASLCVGGGQGVAMWLETELEE